MSVTYHQAPFQAEDWSITGNLREGFIVNWLDADGRICGQSIRFNSYPEAYDHVRFACQECGALHHPDFIGHDEI